MTDTVLGRLLDRRAVIGLIAASLPSSTGLGGGALERSSTRSSVREVVAALQKTETGGVPDLSHRDLSGLDLADLDFKGADLSHSNLFGADLTASDLEGANLSHAMLDRSILIRTRFTNADLANASIRRPSVASDLNFDARNLPIFRRANLSGAQLTARLDGADFTEADLSNASFSLWHERDLGGAPATGLNRCNFTGARMPGVNMRGLSLVQASFREADLRDADLRDCDMRNADLTGALLDGAKLRGSRLEGATGLSALRPASRGD